jgi:hypothetical protein
MYSVSCARRASHALALILAAIATEMLSLAATTPNADEIVRKSVEAIKSDWAQAPKYSFLERDVESKRHFPAMSKTYRVLMIDGSPYNLVTATNDQPLSTSEKAEESRKLEREIDKRRTESERERRRRIARYDRERDHDHEMLEEMVGAFEFHLTGQARVDGHDCWALDAEPKPGYEPTNHAGRILKGMKGRLWIDKATTQWVKVQAEVVKPVNFFGFLARVGPGTQFELEQAPLANGVWMPTAFNVSVRASALGLFSENSNEYETYRDYQPMPQASALLQSTK